MQQKDRNSMVSSAKESTVVRNLDAQHLGGFQVDHH
jgi:hypothetical protein